MGWLWMTAIGFISAAQGTPSGAAGLLQDRPAGRTTADSRELEKEARKRIAWFKESIRKTKDVYEVMTAVHVLGAEQHPLIRDQLGAVIAERAQPNIVEAAAHEISRYRDDPRAALYLLNGLQRFKPSSDSEVETAIRLFDAIGRLGHKPAAAYLEPYFTHSCPQISAAAINAAGSIGATASVDPLISLLAAVEAAKREKCLFDDFKPLLQTALANITGHEEKNAKAWAGWWAKNKEDRQLKEHQDEQDRDD